MLNSNPLVYIKDWVVTFLPILMMVNLISYLPWNSQDYHFKVKPFGTTDQYQHKYMYMYTCVCGYHWSRDWSCTSLAIHLELVVVPVFHANSELCTCRVQQAKFQWTLISLIFHYVLQIGWILNSMETLASTYMCMYSHSQVWRKCWIIFLKYKQYWTLQHRGSQLWCYTKYHKQQLFNLQL